MKKVYMKNVDKVSMAASIKAKCLDCTENIAAVRDCHICKCPLWAYRFGANLKAAINRLAKYYDVVLVDENTDYVESTKGKRLKHAVYAPQCTLGANLSEEDALDDKFLGDDE